MGFPVSKDPFVAEKPKRRKRRKQRSCVAAIPSQAMFSTGAYRSAQKDRRHTQDWNPDTKSASAATLSDLEVLRPRSADLARNAPEAVSAVNQYKRHVVGNGLWPQSQIKNDYLQLPKKQIQELQKRAEMLFRIWGEKEDCDASRVCNFPAQQAMALEGRIVRGDIFVLRRFLKRKTMPFELCNLLVEADRVAQPSAFDDVLKSKKGRVMEAGGIRFDRNGAPTHYHILNEHPGDDGATKTREGDWYSAYGKTGHKLILHIFEACRPTQPRGVPLIAPAGEDTKLLNRLLEATSVSAVVQSLFTAFIESPNGEGLDEAGDPFVQTSSSEPGDYKLGNGAILDLREGEKVHFADPSRPNSAIDAFANIMMRRIGMVMDIPIEVLAMQFLTSYTAARAADKRAWLTWFAYQYLLATKLCQPTWELFWHEAVAKGYLDAPGFFTDPLARWAYCNAKWSGPVPTSIDPIKDAKAEQVLLEAKIKTLKQSVEERGGDYEQHIIQLKQEKEDLKDLQPQQIVEAKEEPDDEEETDEEERD